MHEKNTPHYPQISHHVNPQQMTSRALPYPYLSPLNIATPSYPQCEMKQNLIITKWTMVDKPQKIVTIYGQQISHILHLSMADLMNSGIHQQLYSTLRWQTPHQHTHQTPYKLSHTLYAKNIVWICECKNGYHTLSGLEFGMVFGLQLQISHTRIITYVFSNIPTNPHKFLQCPLA